MGDWKLICAADTAASKAERSSDFWDDEGCCNYSSDGTKLLDAENFPEKVTVLPGTRIICDGAFAFQDYMAGRRIGEKVPDEERSSPLEKAVLPDGLTHIGRAAFRECGWMRSLRFPAGLLYIGDEAFSCCYELRSASFPASLVAIGDDAFSDCFSLEKVRLNKGLKAIGAGAFFCCESLSEISLPASLEFIGDEAFAYCKSLRKIFVPSGTEGKFSAMLPEALRRRIRPLR